MKKITALKIATVLGAIMFAVPALASTGASFSPDTINSGAGKDFTIAVSISPSGTTDYAEKIEVSYPKDLVEVKSFSQASLWMSLTQSGYDFTDNTNGVLIKSAGYPNGFSKETVFGTITFHTKTTGTGKIVFGANSKAYQETTQTSITGNEVVLNITGNEESVATQNGSGVTTKVAVSPKPKPKTDITPSEVPLTASASGTGFMFSWYWILILIFLGIIARVGYNKYKKGKNTEAVKK